MFSASERAVLKEGLILAARHYDTRGLPLRPEDPVRREYEEKLALARYLQWFFDQMFPLTEECGRREGGATPASGAEPGAAR